MSWRDRPYAGDESFQPQMRMQFRKPSKAVTWLIIANIAVFFIQVLSLHWSPAFLLHTFGLSLAGIKSLHFWQPVTYMFFHDPGDVFHLLINMLGLYIFGSEFERAFGRERFLQFYGTCGIVGGLAYLALSLVWPVFFFTPLIGASGAVYGLLLAAIIFFPHIQVILIIFPMPVRVFGLILAAILLFRAISPGGLDNPGGEVCHVAGAATGLVFFYAWGLMPKMRLGFGQRLPNLPFGRKTSRPGSEGAWARKQKNLAEQQAEVDRILAKVHDQGIQNLTRKEKKILARATKREQQQERQLGRTDRL